MYTKMMYLLGSLGMNSETSSITAGLTGTPLELAYVKSRGAAHLKCASNSFVMFDRQTEKLTIFGTPPDLASGSFLDEHASYVLEDAQKHGPRWPPQTAPLVAGQTAPGRTGWIMTIPG